MIYLDTSAAVPMFIPEPASDAVDAWYEACTEPLIASDWILTEFASALSIKERRGEVTTKQARAAWKDFTAFCNAGIRLLPVTRQAFENAASMTLKAASGLRAGDSLHLSVALEAGASGIATADAVLAENAKAKGLDVKRF